MSKIKNQKKYNSATQRFTKVILQNEKGLAFSNAKNIVIADEEDSKLDYIIFCNGNRVKDISKDLITPYGQRDYVDRISKYFERHKKNVFVEHILLDNDAPLNVEVKTISNHINKLSVKEKCRSLQLIGHSKGADIYFNIPKYFKNMETYKMSSMYLTAPPYEGCFIAEKTNFLGNANKVIMSQLPYPLSEYTFEALKKYYERMHSNSYMDNDIARIGYKSANYDPSFIRDMFSIDNLLAIQKLNYFHNFVTGIDEKTLLKSIKQRDYVSIAMCLIDKYFIDKPSDGFIEQSSQLAINKYLNIKNTIIPSTTHYFLSQDENLEMLLDIVNDQIDQIKEKELLNKKRVYIKL